MTDRQPPPDEYFEHIPWDELMAEVESRRRTTLRWGAGIVGVLAVVAAVAWPGRPSPPSGPATEAPAATVTTVTTLAPETPPTVTTAPPPVWAEADLRAVESKDLERAAAGAAEWVLRELFTADGGGDRSAVLVDPDLPGPQPGTRSFVEWVSVSSVRDVGAGRYSVQAVVGRLVAAPGEEYRRIPPQAFRLLFDLSTDPPTLLDLPAPSAFTPPSVPAGVGEPAQAPDDVVAAATEVFARFGEVGTVETFAVGGRWRVVGGVVDPGGVTWPLVVWLDGDGNEVDPPPRGP